MIIVVGLHNGTVVSALSSKLEDAGLNPALNPAFLSGVCMCSLCMHRFSSGFSLAQAKKHASYVNWYL